jgi:hypothetical protein
MIIYVALLVVAAVLVVALVLLVRFRIGRGLARTRYSTPLPTWGGSYRDSLARRVTKPDRIRPRRGEDTRLP